MDIARDVDSSSAVADSEKRLLNLGDKQGRPIAARWITEALSASDGDYLGIVILWDTRSEADDQHRLNFVLLKGEASGEGFKIVRVVYGDPLQ